MHFSLFQCNHFTLLKQRCKQNKSGRKENSPSTEKNKPAFSYFLIWFYDRLKNHKYEVAL